MKLQQLRYIVEVARSELNISLASERLFTSQPGVSKQIKQLEDELGVTIFARTGKQLTHITEVGQKIINLAQEILNKSDEIVILSQEVANPHKGSLSVSATNTQARYFLPNVIQSFMADYPEIELKLNETQSKNGLAQIEDRTSDFVITSNVSNLSDLMIALPCYHWNKSVIVKKDHPLAKLSRLTLSDIVAHPIICYDLSMESDDIKETLLRENLEPNIVLTTTDAELVKTYVKLGVGVGIIANLAISDLDSELVALNVGHLFHYSTTYIVFLRSLFLRTYMLDFIQQFSPHLKKDLIYQALSYEKNEDVFRLFHGVKLPIN